MVNSKDWFIPLLFFETIVLINSFGMVLKGEELVGKAELCHSEHFRISWQTIFVAAMLGLFQPTTWR